MNFTAIEEAGFQAWPAFRQFNHHGWVSRFADGYTKRANSVTVLSPNSMVLENQILACEEQYHKKYLSCIFRLLSFNDNSGIESILDSRGYKKGDHSLVLTREILNTPFPSMVFPSLPVEDWMRHYCALSGKEFKDHATHIKMIHSIRDEHLLAVLLKNSRPVSCGLGVIHKGYFGIFDIVTHPDLRNKGYGKELVGGMLAWAVEKSAHTAYLQVVSDNRPAIRLYHGLGYGPAYEYYYKIES
ncbi:MAG: GNAT family N-acetyltransferase [Desulfobacteraceae bacterium]|nr:GNAT family N-acetyltransferase [Desulfobacteraceae bacterium]